MTQEEIKDGVLKVLNDSGAMYSARLTHFFRVIGGEQKNFYIELQVDADGNMSYSSNLPNDLLRAHGKGLMWPKFDERYQADLAKVIEEMNKL